MPIYRISDPSADSTSVRSSSFLTSIGEGESRCCIIAGTGYTHLDHVAERAVARGFGVETVSRIPDGYAEQAARLKPWPDEVAIETARVEAWPYEIVLEPRDGADPEHHHRFANTLHVNTSRAPRSTRDFIDIRDVRAGLVSADDVVTGTY